MYQADKPLPLVIDKGRSDKDHTYPPPHPISKSSLYEEYFQPAIDGPPSPQSIREYTTRMKLSSHLTAHGTPDNSIDHTMLHHTTPSSRSGSVSGPEVQGLSRNSSKSSRQSQKSDRPESTFFGKTLFSRSKKSKRNTTAGRAPSSLSNYAVDEQTSTRDRIFGGGNGSSLRRGPQYIPNTQSEETASKLMISGPFNFQHVTHTKQEHLPGLESTTGTDLVSEFSALRASQAPSHGQLKRIHASDLHFDNFSSEALNKVIDETATEWRPRTGHTRTRQGTIASMSSNPGSPSRKALSKAQSHDSLRQSPPRIRRTALELPESTGHQAQRSASTASMFWNSYEAILSPSLDRPKTSATTLRRPNAFHLPISPPMLVKHSTDDYFFDQSAGQRVPELEYWPLPSPLPAEKAPALPDVPEEDEHAIKRRSQVSRVSVRHSKSMSDVGHLIQQHVESLETQRIAQSPVVTESAKPEAPKTTNVNSEVSPMKKSIEIFRESWEDDIDYCYDHEAEADCDYEWNRTSIDGYLASLKSSQELCMPRQLHSQRYRPSLSVPLPGDLPTISHSASTTPTTTPNPLTPASQFAPSIMSSSMHLRSRSQASSFKESHGFSLSPSLLIPGDFQKQLSLNDDDDRVYNDAESYPYLHMNMQVNPGINSRSSTITNSSFYSSAFSHTSHRSQGSNTTFGSTTALKSLAQESIIISTTSIATPSNPDDTSAATTPINEVSAIQPLGFPSPPQTIARKPLAATAAASPLSRRRSKSHSPVSVAIEKMEALERERAHTRKTSAPTLTMAASGKHVPGRLRSSSVAGKQPRALALFPQC